MNFRTTSNLVLKSTLVLALALMPISALAAEQHDAQLAVAGILFDAVSGSQPLGPETEEMEAVTLRSMQAWRPNQ